tara:strand:+ start:196 stop:477 length:282 start_codon:yes stop_codon:yes gene_type:complete
MAKLTGKAKAHFLKRMEKGRKAARKTRHAKYKTAKGKNKKASAGRTGSRVNLRKRLEAIELELSNLRERHGTDKSLKGDLLRAEKSELDAGDW